MPAGATYFPIASIRMTSTSLTVSFTSIPNTYTDLVLVSDVLSSSSTGASEVTMRFNNDTGANYTMSGLYQYLSTTPTRQAAQQDKGWISYNVTPSNVRGFSAITSIYEYANAKLKNWHTKASSVANGSTYQGVEYYTGYWNNTSAISSITLGLGAQNNYILQPGTTFSLYGITKA